MAKKIGLGLLAIFVVFYLVSQPREAADGARTILDAIGSVFRSLVTFFSELA